MTKPKLVVVGGGPAGLSAATEAARLGLEVTVVDENARLGGQYYRGRQASTEAGSPRHFAQEAPDVQTIIGSAVVDAPAEGALSVWSEETGLRSLEYDALVIATGAYDRTVALPGWTLPGVLTAGGASTLAKVYGVLPGRKALVAGSGPFLLSVADDLAHAGCEVQVVEATPLSTSAAGLPVILRDGEIARQTFGYLNSLRAQGVRRHYSSLVTAIHGTDRVESATIQKVDADWRPVPGTEKTVAVDVVCLGFGFVPQLELAQALGCAIGYRAEASEFYVKTDEAMRTSQSRTYAAGEVAGIGGVRVAAAEGRLAGLTAALDTGLLKAEAYAEQTQEVQGRLAKARRVADWIRKAFSPRPGLWSLAEPETIVCRCEDVRLKNAEAALADNPATPYAVKTATRAGMGLCQGRICSPYIIEWLRAHKGFDVPANTWPWRVRPPLRPVGLGDWLLESAPQ